MRSIAAVALTVSSWMLASPAFADEAQPPVSQGPQPQAAQGIAPTQAAPLPQGAPPPRGALASPSAREFGIVHLETSDDVALEMQQNGEWIVVCEAPCNRPLPFDGNYRINGSGIRTSAPFRLQRGGTNLRVEASSSTLHGFSVAITVVGVVGIAPALGVTSILVVGMFFGFALICPIADAVSSSTSYGECLGDIGEFFGAWYAAPGVWLPAVAGAVFVTGGIVGLASSPQTSVTALPSATAGLRRGPDRQPEWRVDPMAAVGGRAVAVPLLRVAF